MERIAENEVKQQYRITAKKFSESLKRVTRIKGKHIAQDVNTTVDMEVDELLNDSIIMPRSRNKSFAKSKNDYINEDTFNTFNFSLIKNPSLDKITMDEHALNLK